MYGGTGGGSLHSTGEVKLSREQRRAMKKFGHTKTPRKMPFLIKLIGFLILWAGFAFGAMQLKVKVVDYLQVYIKQGHVETGQSVIIGFLLALLVVLGRRRKRRNKNDTSAGAPPHTDLTSTIDTTQPYGQFGSYPQQGPPGYPPQGQFGPAAPGQFGPQQNQPHSW